MPVVLSQETPRLDKVQERRAQVLASLQSLFVSGNAAAGRNLAVQGSRPSRREGAVCPPGDSCPLSLRACRDERGLRRVLGQLARGQGPRPPPASPRGPPSSTYRRCLLSHRTTPSCHSPARPTHSLRPAVCVCVVGGAQNQERDRSPARRPCPAMAPNTAQPAQSLEVGMGAGPGSLSLTG